MTLIPGYNVLFIPRWITWETSSTKLIMLAVECSIYRLAHWWELAHLCPVWIHRTYPLCDVGSWVKKSDKKWWFKETQFIVSTAIPPRFFALEEAFQHIHEKLYCQLEGSEIKDIKVTVQSMNSKVSGPDGILQEIYKFSFRAPIEHLHQFFFSCSREGKWSHRNLKDGNIIKIYNIWEVQHYKTSELFHTCLQLGKLGDKRMC